jgi:hypothetical protein
VIWKVDHTKHRATIYAGNGGNGYSGDGNLAIKAQIGQCSGVAVNAAGDVYFTAQSVSGPTVGRWFVRKILASSQFIQNFAGSTTANGFDEGDGGPASRAILEYAGGIAVDGAGNVYIAEQNRVRVVNPKTKIISNFAGNGTVPAGNGVSAQNAAFTSIQAVAANAAGDLFISDNYGTIFRVDAEMHLVTSVAGTGAQADFGDGGPAASAGIYANYLAISPAGKLYFSGQNAQIRAVDLGTGIISSPIGNGYFGFSGDGGSASLATLSSLGGISFDSAGNLYLGDANRVRQVTFAGSPSGAH